jgi:predicted porin
MKPSSIALAVLGALAGPALAQSSVTIYGIVDAGVGKNIGTKDKAVQESAAGTSRLGFKGVEDLGGGMAALFQFEHRFRPDVGADATSGTRFWHGMSTVGLRSSMGTLTLGRQFTPAFLLVQNQVDPFAGVTVANLRDVGMRPGAANQVAGTPNGVATVTKVRVSDSIRYDFGTNGFNVGASIGEATQENGTATGPDRPWSVALNYDVKPFFVGVGYENPQGGSDYQWNVAARYAIGPATLSAGYSSGRTEPTATRPSMDFRGWLVAVNYSLGPGDIKAGYATSRIGSGATGVQRKRIGVGYHYNLSKRTRLYMDVGHEREISANKTGYDFGIMHFF